MGSVWDGVIGQQGPVEVLRRGLVEPVHAYLFVGQQGCGSAVAARAAAARILAGSDDAADRVCDLVMRGVHPDVHEIRREGASLLKAQAEEIIRLSATTGAESARKVIIVDDVHTMDANAAARLLKTVEEPPDGVVLILLADRLVPSLVTIASRCVSVHFSPLTHETVVAALVADGAAPDDADAAARFALGDLERARLLVHDPGLARRYEAFAAVPRRLDGTGATVATIAAELTDLVEASLEALKTRHSAEIAAKDTELAASGTKRGGKKALEDRHRREIRQHRTDELRTGLSRIAATYRDEMVERPELHNPETYARAVGTVHEAIGRLGLNVNEALLLRGLLWSLPAVRTDEMLHGATR